MNTNSILVTGSSGFVGQHLLAELTKRGISFQAHRHNDALCSEHTATAGGGAMSEDIFSRYQFDTVIHLAGRAHVMKERAAAPLAEFRKANVEHTIAIAKRAAECGVKRFIFVSSIKVNGEETFHKPYSETDIPNPQDAYGISKYETEKALLTLPKTGLEITIIRPPLIYGSNVKGNLKRLTQWASGLGFGLTLPLPLGRVLNQRSLLYVGNLIDLLILCTKHPLAANQIFLAADNETVSTTHLLQRLALAKKSHALLLPVPQNWLSKFFISIGKQSIAQRLLGNLEVDNSKAKSVLSWHPPFTFEEGIRASVGKGGH